MYLTGECTLYTCTVSWRFSVWIELAYSAFGSYWRQIEPTRLAFGRTILPYLLSHLGLVEQYISLLSDACHTCTYTFEFHWGLVHTTGPKVCVISFRPLFRSCTCCMHCIAIVAVVTSDGKEHHQFAQCYVYIHT